MHIPDLENIGSGHVAVGWLHPDHPFSKGKVPQEFVSRIRDLAKRWGESIKALGWGAAGGFHTCEFCGTSHASGTFGVPVIGQMYYVPEMIAHYVDKHSYAPPIEFISAVLACPLPGTPEYESAVQPLATHFGELDVMHE